MADSSPTFAVPYFSPTHQSFPSLLGAALARRARVRAPTRASRAGARIL